MGAKPNVHNTPTLGVPNHNDTIELTEMSDAYRIARSQRPSCNLDDLILKDVDHLEAFQGIAMAAETRYASQGVMKSIGDFATQGRSSLPYEYLNFALPP